MNLIRGEGEMLNRERWGEGGEIGKLRNLLLTFEYGGCLMIRCKVLAQRFTYLELPILLFTFSLKTKRRNRSEN